MAAATNLELIGEHLLTQVAEAEDKYRRTCGRRRRVNSLFRSLALREQLSMVREGLMFSAYTASGAGPMWLSRQGPASRTLDLTMHQLAACQEELECVMEQCVRAHIAIGAAEARHSATALLVSLRRGGR